MATSSVTSKGQITIPKRIREQLRLRTGDKVDFSVEQDGTVKLHPIAKRVSEVFGAFASKVPERLSDAEIKRRLKRAFKEGKI
jgi:AbrB family looped-hinge helix DNA binding protein